MRTPNTEVDSEAPITGMLTAEVVRIASGISRFADGLLDAYHEIADNLVSRTAELVGGLARSIGERLLGGNGTPNPRDGPSAPPLAPLPVPPQGPPGACSASSSGAGCSGEDGLFYKEFAAWTPRLPEPAGGGGLLLNASEAVKLGSYYPLVGERPG